MGNTNTPVPLNRLFSVCIYFYCCIMSKYDVTRPASSKLVVITIIIIDFYYIIFFDRTNFHSILNHIIFYFFFTKTINCSTRFLTSTFYKSFALTPSMLLMRLRGRKYDLGYKIRTLLIIIIRLKINFLYNIVCVICFWL